MLLQGEFLPILSCVLFLFDESMKVLISAKTVQGQKMHLTCRCCHFNSIYQCLSIKLFDFVALPPNIKTLYERIIPGLGNSIEPANSQTLG